jgi:uncharacterized protein (UPF0147 family)
MWLEQSERTMDTRVDAQTVAMRAEALERVLAVLDRVSDDVTVPDLIARIEREADKETIRLLRRPLA